jgi:hypothetical protein
VLANEPVPILDQQDEQVEDLWLDGYSAVAAPNFVGVRVDQAIVDPKDHRLALPAEHRPAGRRLSLVPWLNGQGPTAKIQALSNKNPGSLQAAIPGLAQCGGW